jgi:Tfp pilus assembly protein PilF
MNRLRADWLTESATDANRVDVDKAWGEVARHATKALELEKRPVDSREAAVEALGNEQMEHDDYAAAALSFTELTQIRRVATDWYNLGLCFGKLQRFAEAEQAFREAIRLDATYAAPYRSLSVLYRSIDPTASQQCAAIAQRLLSQ